MDAVISLKAKLETKRNFARILKTGVFKVHTSIRVCGHFPSTLDLSTGTL